ncbi:hypothetical protein [Legionella quateirensis]|uniref:Uncharacterized protein n=1 Tax=Legionella quateirensis TaxID=45072 RepID=A0A378KPM3_9GAMM|nr:hypothetical protein [Legionella quateirensis]KTD52964.1 hypothetical protein Lqua_0797 [Legionella quateirensis]STY16306.1 Uncharacterised protein [Legionella quateirensis]
MFARNFFRMIGKCMPYALDQSNVRVGRMAAETTEDIIRKEFENELKKEGWHSIRERIQVEELVLDELTNEKHQLQQAVERSCLTPAIERARQGYSVRGVFWEEMQKNRKHVAPSETLKVLDEQIDWLNTRQKIFEEINAYTSINRPFS